MVNIHKLQLLHHHGHVPDVHIQLDVQQHVLLSQGVGQVEEQQDRVVQVLREEKRGGCGDEYMKQVENRESRIKTSGRKNLVKSSVCRPMRPWQDELSMLMYLYMLWTWLTVALMLEEIVSISMEMEFRRLSKAEKRSPPSTRSKYLSSDWFRSLIDMRWFCVSRDSRLLVVLRVAWVWEAWSRTWRGTGIKECACPNATMTDTVPVFVFKSFYQWKMQPELEETKPPRTETMCNFREGGRKWSERG
ncbi:hypothetical protein EYF80_029125 [Liparis tanakae]|uniref:Uncharacterized protein n=1 Tax=Liparis tanakae TaxID=230148 RepID=A0A4Z2H750_9TELE|nr:hypothetical protein EYF80_029125 [Liparis tanakae]